MLWGRCAPAARPRALCDAGQCGLTPEREVASLTGLEAWCLLLSNKRVFLTSNVVFPTSHVSRSLERFIPKKSFMISLSFYVFRDFCDLPLLTRRGNDQKSHLKFYFRNFDVTIKKSIHVAAFALELNLARQWAKFGSSANAATWILFLTVALFTN